MADNRKELDEIVDDYVNEITVMMAKRGYDSIDLLYVITAMYTQTAAVINQDKAVDAFDNMVPRIREVLRYQGRRYAGMSEQ